MYVITLHCVGASERNALFTLYITSHIALCTLGIGVCTVDIGHCTVHIGHCTLHCVGASEHRLIWRRPLRTEAMSRYRWEPQHLRNQCTMRQPVHYMAKYTAICNRTKCNAIGVIVGRFLFKQAILVLAFVCSFTKTHTTAAMSSLASARNGRDKSRRCCISIKIHLYLKL